MSNKPRASLLDLFDPLLENAINTPVPESPPGTPRRAMAVDSKENINGLTMTAFFKRISESQIYTKPSDNSAILIDIDDLEHSGDSPGQKARTPLLVKEPNFDIATISSSQGLKVKALKKSFIPSTLINQPSSPLSLSKVSPLQNSPTCEILPRDGSGLLPPIITTDESQTSSCERCSNTASTGLAKVNGAHSRRRSSIDISAALSSTSLNIPDFSFDLLNGDISLLSKTSERDDSQASDADMHRSTPNFDQVDLHGTSAANREIYDICNLGCDSDHLVNDSKPNALAKPPPMLHRQEVAESGSQFSQYETQKSTPRPIRTGIALPAPVKKSKIFTSHRKILSTDVTTTNLNGCKQHIPQPVYQTNTGRMATSSSSITLPKMRGGAKRVLINADKATSAVAMPTRRLLSGKNAIVNPKPRSDVLPPRMYTRPTQLVPSNSIPLKNISIGTGIQQAPCRLPAPAQMKGRDNTTRPVAKAGTSGIAKAVRGKV